MPHSLAGEQTSDGSTAPALSLNDPETNFWTENAATIEKLAIPESKIKFNIFNDHKVADCQTIKANQAYYFQTVVSPLGRHLL
jgi:hypothetical protein